MSDEQRNDLRKWSDYVHKVATLGSIGLLGWVLLTVHDLDKSIDQFSTFNTRLTALEIIRIEIAKSHYTKPEVESLVDRSIRPLQRDISRLEATMVSKLDKIYDEVKK